MASSPPPEDGNPPPIETVLSQLKTWYSNITPVRLDILGDFAGSELFLVEGDTLIRHALTSAFTEGAVVDMDEGWQILHAVAVVERFLANLRKRGCKFQVVFFDSHKHLSVPSAPISNPRNRYKYLVARECIVQHLLSNVGTEHFEKCVYTFANFTDGQFDEFLNRQRPYFIMCHDHGLLPPQLRPTKALDGDEGYSDGENTVSAEALEDEEKTIVLSFIWHVMDEGYRVGLTNEVEFLDSKVFTHVLSPWKMDENRDSLAQHKAIKFTHAEPTPQDRSELKALLPQMPKEGFSSREIIVVLALANLLLSSPDDRKQLVSKYAAHFLLHTTLLARLSLEQRHLPSVSFSDNGAEVDAFSEVIGGEILELLQDDGVISEIRKLSGTTGDLVDGRLFRNVIASSADTELEKLLEQCAVEIKEHYQNLKATLLDVTKGQSPILEGMTQVKASLIYSEPQPKAENLQVLPFSNPVFASHLKGMDLPIEGVQPHQTLSEKTLYETSISGAAMRKLKRGKTGPMENYQPSEKKKWWQLKGEQLFQAEMLRYALSLSGTGGVGLAPERIITASASERKKETTPSPAQIEKKDAVGKNKNQKVNPKAGGKSTSSKAAEIIATNAAAKAAKAGKKAPDVWKQFYTTEVASSRTDRGRIAVLTDFIQKSVDENYTVEARLLKCCYLFSIWRAEYCSATVRAKEGFEVIALLFSEATKLVISPALTKQIKAHLDALFSVLGFAPLSLKAGASALPSKPPTITPPPVPTASVTSDFRVGMSSLDFQLKYCGPYMDRNLDSSDDPRVRFQPDRWQRNVLDALDADKSVFVVAPTSAGKTFIAYYAMEKILRNSDDDVLVYVAPTKPLVNQIAAELQARFMKDYPKQPGKTVWAIHTGDYSIYNPQKCQILVTVPQVLQQMLLSPALAATWSPRVKRIILDEVHCIGQSDVGYVWEQLLLLAPCPIIALSATVGNPGEFHQWLQISQAGLQWKGSSEKKESGKSVEVVMIHHKHRFNNLRTFYYKGDSNPTEEAWAGLKQAKAHSLGLADLESSKGFKHLHPIAALGDDAGSGIPEDLSLESRDCYALYKAMEQVQTQEHPLPTKLAPGNGWFPEIIRKADVIVWEDALKAALREWMVKDKSMFLDVVKLLRGEETPQESNEVKPASGAPVSITTSQTTSQSVQDGDKDDDKDDNGEDAEQIQKLTSAIKELSPHQKKAIDETLDMLSELNNMNALPALLFSYERSICDILCVRIVNKLVENEKRWRETSKEWKKKLAEKELYLKRKEEADKKSKFKKVVRKKGGEDDQDDIKEQNELDSRGDDASSAIAAFDPEAPSEQYSFAGRRNISMEDLERDLVKLKKAEVADVFIEGLRRGIGIHHGGLSRTLLQCVERLFRKGYLRVVIATGTLSLGINMPCATVVFVTDNASLTPLNFRQASGRAGRRGFDLLGNVIFHGLPVERTRRLINSNLPSLMGHFPTSTTLILRLFILLHGSNNAPHAVATVNSLLSQTRLSVAGGSENFRDQVTHHIRFSIEYLRRMCLLNENGEPTNFAALAAHLYYVEPSNFMFNVLMREGVFHDICAPLSAPGKDSVDSETVKQEVNRKLMLVLAHIFGRVSFRKSDDVESFKAMTQSMVMLPELPEEAADVLRRHNAESLAVFSKYVITYATQFKQGKKDNTLPYSQKHIGGKAEIATPEFLHPIEPTHARSSFAALSGHTDGFKSISELQSSSRDDILLEASGVPYLPVDGVRLNAYLYDFLQHGNPDVLATENHLRRSKVWFMLNDFSAVLATIIITLKNLINVGPEGEMRMGDFAVTRGVGEDVLEEIERMAAEADTAGSTATTTTAAKGGLVGKKKTKSNWFDEDAGGNTSAPTGGNQGYDEDEDDEDEELFADAGGDSNRQALMKVLKGFVELQGEFNTKFRAMFATKKDAQRARKKALIAQREANPQMVKEKKPKLKLR